MMRETFPTFLGLAFVCATVGAGCHTPPPLTTPQHFVELEEATGSWYAYRATSADGVVIAVRALEVDPRRGGDLAFWLDALRLRLSQMGGYALLGSDEIVTRAGWKGTRLHFGYDDKGRPHSYWVAVFLQQAHLYLIEAGGPDTKFHAHEAEITSAMKSFTP
jgi:hypothetical protein